VFHDGILSLKNENIGRRDPTFNRAESMVIPFAMDFTARV
jgi:hypothetical protein